MVVQGDLDTLTQLVNVYPFEASKVHRFKDKVLSYILACLS
jgi:hypothetical protein